MVQKYLGQGIAKWITLTSLNKDLSSNRIGEDGTKCLGEGISKVLLSLFLNLDLRDKVLVIMG